MRQDPRFQDPTLSYLGLQGFTETLHSIRMASSADDTPVMILGETGTGKSHLARHICETGVRAGAPIETASLGAIPVDMHAADLFGTWGNAYTQDRERPGLLERAGYGTVILNDIHLIAADCIGCLLPATDDDPRARQIRRLGSKPDGTSPLIPVSARLIGTAGKDLSADSQWRHLYYRLAGIVIHLPPLRERPEDIEALFQYFILSLSREAVIAGEVFDALARHTWPGNVRELRQAARYAVDSCRIDGRSEMDLGDLPQSVRSPAQIDISNHDGRPEIEDAVWKDLHGSERLFVHFWPDIAKAIEKSRSETGKINWAKAVRLLERSRIPVTGVQIRRKVRKVVRRLLRTRSLDQALKVPPRELAQSILGMRTVRTGYPEPRGQ